MLAFCAYPCSQTSPGIGCVFLVPSVSILYIPYSVTSLHLTPCHYQITNCSSTMSPRNGRISRGQFGVISQHRKLSLGIKYESGLLGRKKTLLYLGPKLCDVTKTNRQILSDLRTQLPKGICLVTLGH